VILPISVLCLWFLCLRLVCQVRWQPGAPGFSSTVFCSLKKSFLCSREHQIGMGLVCVPVHACEPPADAARKMCVPLIYNHQRKQNCKSHPQIFLIGDACNKQTHHEFPGTGRSPPSLGSHQLPAPLGLWGSHGLVP
ncbi:mCG144928, partial [Mus musculus]